MRESPRAFTSPSLTVRCLIPKGGSVRTSGAEREHLGCREECLVLENKELSCKSKAWYLCFKKNTAATFAFGFVSVFSKL